MSSEWDERHLNADRAEPLPLVVEFAQRLAPGKALDLACGTGRHALWLAQHGWEVTAVDSSPVAIGLLRQEARGLPVRAVLADLEKGEFPLTPAAWDLIVVTYYLQRDLLAQLGPALTPGGLVIAVTLMGEGRFRAKPGELRACLHGWEVLHYRETTVAEFVGQKR
jgi:SAM-dependent methyltransferase